MDEDRDERNGYGGERVDVCRKVGSKWFPYVKVTVPFHIADSWVDANKAIWPDEDGKCPKPEKTIRQHVREMIMGFSWRFPSFANR